MKQYERLMGKTVLVTHLLERNETEEDGKHKVFWVSKQSLEQRAGWIVGVRFLQEGIYNASNTDYDGEVEPAYLEVTRIVPAIQVSYWPTMKPVNVPLDGYIEGEVHPRSPSEWSWIRTGEEERNNVKDSLRDEMKDWPRDEKGRWLCQQKKPIKKQSCRLVS